MEDFAEVSDEGQEVTDDGCVYGIGVILERVTEGKLYPLTSKLLWK